MPDREKVIKAVEEAFDMYKSEYDGTSFFDEKEWAENKRDALDLLKEQEHKDRMFHALEDDWKRLNELLKEQKNEKKRNPVIICPHCGKRVK